MFLTRVRSSLQALLCRESKIDRALRLLTTIQQETSTMSPALQKLTDDVAQMKQVNASAVALLQGLSDQIRASKDDPTAMAALANEIEGASASLAAAVTANTPAAQVSTTAPTAPAMPAVTDPNAPTPTDPQS